MMCRVYPRASNIVTVSLTMNGMGLLSAKLSFTYSSQRVIWEALGPVDYLVLHGFLWRHCAYADEGNGFPVFVILSTRVILPL